MKAIHLADNLAAPGLVLSDLAAPVPGEMEVLVKVHAAGVTPGELAWYPTTHQKDGAPRHNAIPGHEFSGTIAAVGRGALGFVLGDAIFGMNDWFCQGATAEYCLASPSTLARKPRKLTHIEAAAVPIAALTAWQALFDHARIESGERILVHGGAGSVGSFVIQLAKMHGAEVIATASGRGLELLATLKVDEAVDYKTTSFERTVAPVDVVFDSIGGDTLARSWPLLTPTGRAVTIASDNESSTDPRVKQAFFIVESNHEQLENISLLIDGGILRPFVGAVVPLSSAPAAYAGTIPRPQGRGKTVIQIV